MLEIASSILGNIPEATMAAILAGLLRNVAGWLENAYKDGKIEKYEIKQLFGTIIKYFSYIMLLMIGLPIEQAVVGTFVIDATTSSVRKINK